MRWFLMSSPVLRGGNLVVTEQGIRDGVRQVMIPLWNVWYFFALYANTARAAQDVGAERGYQATWRSDSTAVLDRYVLAKTHDLVVRVRAELEAYDVAGACQSVRDYLDVLTNWYIRRSRERFWNEDHDAFDTLYTVLEVVCRVAAPLLPLVTEEIWRGLTGGRSVHLTDWPDAASLPADDALVAAMDRAREVASATLALRKAQSLRVRQPLRTLTVVTTDRADLEPFTAVVADEVNVKSVRLVDLDEGAATDIGVSRRLTVNARAAGPRLGRAVQEVIRGSKSGDWSVDDAGTVVCAGVVLHDGEYALETVVDDAGATHRAVAVLPSGGFVVLDTDLDEDLLAEGWARDLIRQVQDRRRAAGLDVSDAIRLGITVPVEREGWTRSHLEMIRSETLAREVEIRSLGSVTDGADEATIELERCG
jgi:isoleucyl-tRNA synthetase